MDEGYAVAHAIRRLGLIAQAHGWVPTRMKLPEKRQVIDEYLRETGRDYYVEVLRRRGNPHGRPSKNSLLKEWKEGDNEELGWLATVYSGGEKITEQMYAHRRVSELIDQGVSLDEACKQLAGWMGDWLNIRRQFQRECDRVNSLKCT